MLIVTRKPRQAISIGDQVNVRVIEVSGNQVRLGVMAPAEMPIQRSELAKPAPASIAQRLRRWLSHS